MSYRTEIIDSLADAERIVPAWRSLASVNGYPMDDPCWQRIAAQFVHPADDRLCLLTVWDDEQLVALAPLMLSVKWYGSHYELIGTKVLYEPASVLARDRGAAQRIATALVSLRRPIVLTRVAPGEFTNAIVEEARGHGWLLLPTASGSPFIDLTSGWTPYHQGLPSRIRNVVRRGERQLARLGQVEFSFDTLAAENTQRLLQEAFEVELHSWKGRAGSAVLMRSDLRDFFFHYVPEIAESGEALVSSLRLDGVPIATQVANTSRRAYWQLKIGYDDRYAKYLPGMILLMQTIKWSCEAGLERYEFLGTFEPWIREWTSDAHPYMTMLFYPFNLRGAGGLLRDSAMRLRDKLPYMTAALRKRLTRQSSTSSRAPSARHRVPG
jgi:CelD/BcsL family acetyltransferase involved in cellulose biosynthesis